MQLRRRKLQQLRVCVNSTICCAGYVFNNGTTELVKFYESSKILECLNILLNESSVPYFV